MASFDCRVAMSEGYYGEHFSENAEEFGTFMFLFVVWK